MSHFLCVRRYRSRWPLIPLEELTANEESVVSAYGDALPEERWLLFVAHDNAQVAAELMHLWTTQHCCLLCQRCLEPLSRVKPALPPRARCNDMWGGRLPEPIRVLTYAETKVLQLARSC